jgi:chromosome segregation ATPase
MSSTAQQTLILAQQQLKDAEAAAAAERKADTEQQLISVRAAGRELKAEFESLAAQIRSVDAEIDACRRDVSSCHEKITLHHLNKPDGLDFPSPEELADWQSELDQLTAARDQVVAELRAIQDRAPSREYAIQLHQKIETLLYSQRNLEGILRGQRLDRWEGGIGPVS